MIEQLERFAHARLAALIPLVPAQQIEIVSFQIPGRADVFVPFHLGELQRPTDRCYDMARNLVLYREHVVEHAVVLLTPQHTVVASARESNRHPHAVLGAAHTPFQHEGDVQ